MHPFIRVLIAALTSILLSDLISDISNRDTAHCLVNKGEMIKRTVTYIAEKTLVYKISGFIKLSSNCPSCNFLPEHSIDSTIFADLEQVSRASVHSWGLSLYHSFFSDSTVIRSPAAYIRTGLRVCSISESSSLSSRRRNWHVRNWTQAQSVASNCPNSRTLYTLSKL